MILQSLEPRPVNAVALQNDGCFVAPHHATRLHHLVGKRKRAVNSWDAVVENDIRLLTHGAKNLAAGQRRTNGIAVRASMRRQHESLVLSDLPEYVFEHVAMAALHGDCASVFLDGVFFANVFWNFRSNFCWN